MAEQRDLNVLISYAAEHNSFKVIWRSHAISCVSLDPHGLLDKQSKRDQLKEFI